MCVFRCQYRERYKVSFGIAFCREDRRHLGGEGVRGKTSLAGPLYNIDIVVVHFNGIRVKGVNKVLQ